jgi:hypothetical protein
LVPALGAWFVLLLTLIHLYFVEDAFKEVRFFFVMVFYGSFLETLFLYTKTYTVAHETFSLLGQCPIWLTAMWLNLAMLFSISIRRYCNSPVVAAIFGALGAPVTYWAGQLFGAIKIGEPMLESFLFLSFGWAVSMPIFMKIGAVILDSDSN